MKKLYYLECLIAAVLLVLATVMVSDSGNVALRVFGSKSMAGIVDSYSKQFETAHPGQRVVVLGTDTTRGSSAVLDGLADVAMVTKPPSKEIELAVARNGVKLEKHQIGWGGIVLIANADMPVKELSLEQVEKMFTGEYVNWNQVGGPDLNIRLICLDPELHGEGEWFQRNVIKEAPFSAARYSVPSSRLVMLHAAGDKRSLGYAAFGIYQRYLKSREKWLSAIKIVRVRRSVESPAILPTLNTITNKMYPLLVPLYLCINSESAKANAKLFVEFCADHSKQSLAKSREAMAADSILSQ